MSFSRAPADVLGSIFHFLDWRDLNAALQCSRVCYAVVCNSMPSIQGRKVWWERNPNPVGLSLLLASPVAARHLGHFMHRSGGFNVEQLTLIADRLTRLRTLEIALTFPAPPPAIKGKAKPAPDSQAGGLNRSLRFSASLTSLVLTLSGEQPLDEEATLISNAPARCVQLQTLQLCGFCVVPFAPLAAALPHLHTLRVPFICLFPALDQCAAVRSLPSLTLLQLTTAVTPKQAHYKGLLTCLTASPNSMQLKQLELGKCSLSNEVAECLARLPSLQSFECTGFATVTQVDFLRSLAQLTTLSLMWMQASGIAPDVIVNAVRPLSQMRTLSLSLEPGMRSSHLAAILGGMHRLTALTLVHFGSDPDWLDSLRFLTDSAAALQSLDSLHISRHPRGPARLDSSELLHALVCKSLSDLKMFNVFAQPMDEALCERISAGCPELPLLRWTSIEDM